jgi:tetratricopeptide (TPR) repeat protein
LKLQAAACREAQTALGQAFLAGARGARDVSMDPCKAQPITLVAETRVELGRGAKRSTRPAWERMYEHGMALVASLPQQLGEAKEVLEHALAAAPDARARAMVHAQLGWVASRQNHVDDALAHVETARGLLGADPPVFDAIVADAYMRMNRYADAIAAAKSCTTRAPQNSQAWSVYARALVAAENYPDGLAAAREGLVLAPRDPALLAAQATALAALRDPKAPAAQLAYTRFRAPDEAPGLRIRCARGNAACGRDRNPVMLLPLTPE